jgi:hypothetical protein
MDVFSVLWSNPRLYNRKPRLARESYMFMVYDKAKPDIEINIRGLKLAVVKLTTVQVTKLLL